MKNKEEIIQVLILLGFNEVKDHKIRKKYLKDEKNNAIEVWQWRDYKKYHMCILPSYYENLTDLFGTATNFIAEVSKNITIDKFKSFAKDLKNK